MKFFLYLFILFAKCTGSKIPEQNLAAYSFSNVAGYTQQYYKVIGIKDGDTFVLLVDGSPLTIRLAHIDSPERGQPFGSKAKQFASELCFGKMVTLVHTKEYDRNKRLIAEVILADGMNVNKELVRQGYACHFKRYSRDMSYDSLEREARAKLAGMWSDPNTIMPWEYRQSKKQKKAAEN